MVFDEQLKILEYFLLNNNYVKRKNLNMIYFYKLINIIIHIHFSVGLVKSTQPPWMIFKCKTPLNGRYVTAQQNIASIKVSLVEAFFYAI
jgi:hypothetical protein